LYPVNTLDIRSRSDAGCAIESSVNGLRLIAGKRQIEDRAILLGLQ
jgi:hypothetical protein